MAKSRTTVIFLMLWGVAAGCSGSGDGPGTGENVSAEPSGPGEAGSTRQAIDQRSYRLGGIGAFAEMVDAGVKKLALSSPLVPSEMDQMVDEALRIAGEHDVEIFRESDFLVTDLFSAELTEGRDVLIIYRGETLDEYLALKERKLSLVAEAAYSGEARKEIARGFGALLSYSEEKIEALLAEGVSG